MDALAFSGPYTYFSSRLRRKTEFARVHPPSEPVIELWQTTQNVLFARASASRASDAPLGARRAPYPLRTAIIHCEYLHCKYGCVPARSQNRRQSMVIRV
jgi:hypothetical protein